MLRERVNLFKIIYLMTSFIVLFNLFMILAPILTQVYGLALLARVGAWCSSYLGVKKSCHSVAGKVL